uniref:Putative heat shock protein n=1 Tax=Corethrella appendiculata TaxID=1370023 RepID=U5ESP3_9DIPT
MSTVFGIHLGNSNACLAFNKDGKVDVIANNAGNRCTPSFIAALSSEEIVTGLSAKHQTIRNSNLTVINNKVFLDSDLQNEQLEEAIKKLTCPIIESPFQYKLEREEEFSTCLTPVQVASHLFAELSSIALQNQQSNDSKLKCVLSVPLHFSKTSRKNLAEAAQDGGFEVLQIISEPAAAILAYDLDSNEREQNVLVYRLGGISCDATLCSIKHGMIEVTDTIHSKNIGGNLITEQLAEYVAEEFYRKIKLDPRESRRTMLKLQMHSENVKHVLSSMQTAHCFIESLMDGVDWSQNLSRARFENLIQTNLVQYRQVIDELINRNKDFEINQIVVCGGGMKIPKIQQMLSGMFPKANVLTHIIPDEVIALGCAKQAGILTKQWDHEYEHLSMGVEFLQTDIYAKDKNEKEILLFERGVPISTEKRFKVETQSNEEELELDLFEKQDSEFVHLDKVSFELAADRKLNEIELIAKLTLNGISLDLY